MMFGMVLVALALFSGIAVDVSRGYATSSFISSAIDSAALATARELQQRDMDDAEVLQSVQRRFTALVGNREGANVTFDPLSITVDRDAETLKIDATGRVSTYFAGLAGTDTLNVAESTTVNYNVRVVELSMVLDVTGSMNNSVGAESKISALKSAASDLVKKLVPETPRVKSNRVALVPYAATVNPGALTSTVTDEDAPSVDGCVVSRPGDLATTEDLPSSGSWHAVASDPAAGLQDLDPTQGFPDPSSSYGCVASEIVPLSKQRDEILQNIDDLSTGGYTAGHIGAAWGWYMVSPSWSSVLDTDAQPKSYDDEDTIKAVLLMTDGIFNTRFVGADGDKSETQAMEICENMKQKNVLVYAVAFDAPSQAEETLRNCATSDDHYFTAANADQLQAAFKNIASTLTSLRLTN